MIRLVDETNAGETAGNTMFVLGLGPEVHLSLSAVTVYARPLVGLAGNLQNRTNSTLNEDATWAGAFGGGVGLRLRIVPTFTLDLGGDVLKLGELGFARTAVSSGQLTEDPAVLRLRVGLHLAW